MLTTSINHDLSCLFCMTWLQHKYYTISNEVQMKPKASEAIFLVRGLWKPKNFANLKKQKQKLRLQKIQGFKICQKNHSSCCPCCHCLDGSVFHDVSCDISVPQGTVTSTLSKWLLQVSPAKIIHLWSGRNLDIRCGFWRWNALKSLRNVYWNVYWLDLIRFA